MTDYAELIERLRDDPRPNEWKNGLGPAAMEAWHKTCLESAESLRLLLDVARKANDVYEWAEPASELQQAEMLFLFDALTALDKHCDPCFQGHDFVDMGIGGTARCRDCGELADCAETGASR